MKKILAFSLLLLLLFSIAHASALQHVRDEARVLSASEVEQLERQASALFAETGFDVVLHTTNNSQNKSPKDYSLDYYHAFRDSTLYPDGALLAVMFDTRDYNEAARGKGINLLTHRESNDLRNVVASKLSDGNYYDAFNSYLRYVRRLLIPPTALERSIELLPFILIGGLVIGLIYALILKSKLKIAKFKYGAQQYVAPNSLNLTDSQDIYLYQTVTRRKIESNNNRSSGGGFSSGSRGGTSYGSRGGKF